jgi:hypothetical protein
MRDRPSGGRGAGVQDALPHLRSPRSTELTGRRVRNERGTRRWDIDSKSVAAEKERRECAAQPSSRYRPVHFVLRDIHDAMRAGELKSRAPEDVRDGVRRHRAATYAAQQHEMDAPWTTEIPAPPLLLRRLRKFPIPGGCRSRQRVASFDSVACRGAARGAAAATRPSPNPPYPRVCGPRSNAIRLRGLFAATTRISRRCSWLRRSREVPDVHAVPKLRWKNRLVRGSGKVAPGARLTCSGSGHV